MQRRTTLIAFVAGLITGVLLMTLARGRLSSPTPTTTVTAPVTSPAVATNSVPHVLMAKPGPAIPPPPASATVPPSEQEATDLRARTAFAEGQVEAAEGRVSPWPTDVASEYRKEAVEQQLQKFIVDKGLAKIDRMDCSEYPCVGILKLTKNGPEAQQDLHKALQAMVKANYSGKTALAISSASGNGSDGADVAGVAVMPNDPDIMTRTRHRTNELQDSH